MEILRRLLPGGLVFGVHLVPEGGSPGIKDRREPLGFFDPAALPVLIRHRGSGVQKAYQGPGKTEQGRHVFPGGVPQGMVQKGKIGTVDKAVGVNQVKGFFGHRLG